MANETDLAHIPLNGTGTNNANTTTTNEQHRDDTADDNASDDVAIIDATGDSVAFKLGANNGVRIVSATSAPASAFKDSADDDNDGDDGEAMFEPPDGGTRAWLVMLSAFMCNSILFGIINTFGTVYVELQKQLSAAGDSSASGKAGKYDGHLVGVFFFKRI